MAHAAYNYAPGGNTQFQAMKKFLHTPSAHCYLGQVFEHETVGMNTGAGVLFRRMVPMPILATPLGVSEGVSPTSQAFTDEDYTGALTRYAEVYEVTKKNADLSPFKVVNEAVKQLRVKVDRTRERVRHNASRSGTGVLYNTSAISSRITVNGVLMLGRIQRAIADIKANRGDSWTEVDHGSTKVGSSPVEPCFVGFTSTDAEPDLRNIPGCVVTANTTGAKFKGEFCVVQNLRVITNADYIPFPSAGAAIGSSGFRSTDGVSNDVYTLVIVARGALADVKLTGDSDTGMGNGNVVVHDKADKSDPTGERILIAAGWYDLAMVVGDGYMRRIEFTVTANPT